VREEQRIGFDHADLVCDEERIEVVTELQ